MRSLFAAVAAFALVGGLLGGATVVARADGGATQIETELLRLINQYRADLPLPRQPLEAEPCSAAVARTQSWRDLTSLCPAEVGRHEWGSSTSGTSAEEIFRFWTSGYEPDLRTVIGSWVHVGIGCNTFVLDPGVFLCNVVYSNPPESDKFTVFNFGDSYAAGNGVGNGASGWRPQDNATDGLTETRSYQSVDNQANVMRGLLQDFSGRQVTLDDYSHSGSVTASVAEAPASVMDFPGLSLARAKEVLAVDQYERGDVSTIKTVKQQVDRALSNYQTTTAAGETRQMLPPGVIVVDGGGNDIGFDLLVRNLILTPSTEANARLSMDNTKALIDPAISRLKDQIARLVEHASPGTVILVQGYPYLANAEGSGPIKTCNVQGGQVPWTPRCMYDGGTLSTYDPGDDLRQIQYDADGKMATMAGELERTLARQYGVTIGFVSYLAQTDGQAPYLATGKANPNRGVTTAFEVGDSHAFSWDMHEWFHPTAKLRAQEGGLLHAAVLDSCAYAMYWDGFGWIYECSFMNMDGLSDRVEALKASLTTPAGALPAATAGQAYGFTLQVDNAYSYSWGRTFDVVGGQLPDGLDLNLTNGVISGYPTTPGDYAFSVSARATRSFQEAVAEYSIHVDPPPPDSPPAFAVAADSPPVGKAGVPYVLSIPSTGSPGPTFGITGDWPSGLSFNEATGEIRGIPDTPGTYTFTVTATNTVNGQPRSALQEVTIRVEPAGPDVPAALSTPSDGLPKAEPGTPYTFTLAAAGSPAPRYAVTAGALPDGLRLDAGTGVISGTPAAEGTYTFTITATTVVEGYPQSDQRDYTITVGQETTLVAGVPAKLATAAGDLPDGTVGSAYHVTFRATGDPAPAFRVSQGALPDGLSLDPGTGVVAGTPTGEGTYAFTLTVTNAAGADFADYRISVQSAGSGPVEPPRTLTAVTASASAAPGQTQTVRASGFRAGEQVHVTLHSEPVDLGTFTADAEGVVSVTFVVPADMEAGTHAIVFSGTSGTVSVTFTVTRPGSSAGTGGVSGRGGVGALVLVGFVPLIVLSAVGVYRRRIE